ncbi:uncharacterized protein LOC144702964 [Wolffia australiana]
MGAKCCVASRNQEFSERRETQVSAHRNVGLSPLWALQRNNRTHVEDAQVSNHIVSHRIRKNVSDSKTKNRGETGKDKFSSPKFKKTVTDSESLLTSEGSKPASNPIQSHHKDSSAVKEKIQDPEISNDQIPKHPTIKNPSSPASASKGESSSSQSCSLPENPSVEKLTLSSCLARCESTDSCQRCGICKKSTGARSPLTGSGPPVVGVLSCGHVFHADCLENVTAEQDKFDPPCPICSGQPIMPEREGQKRKINSDRGSYKGDLPKRKNGITGRILGIRFSK